MFKIASEPTFTHTVRARVPIDGGFRDETFRVTFRTIAPEEAAGFDLTTAEGSTELLRRIVAGLEDVGDANGNKVEFSDEVLDSVLKLPWARQAIAKTYFEAVAGAKQGN